MVSVAVRRSFVVVVGGGLLMLGLTARRAAAQQVTGDTAAVMTDSRLANAVFLSVSRSSEQQRVEDPPRRIPPTGGPRIPTPLLPPRRTKAYPTIDHDRLSCHQTIALASVTGAAVGALMGAVLYIPVYIGRGDQAASKTFKVTAISGAFLGLIGGSQDPNCRASRP